MNNKNRAVYLIGHGNLSLDEFIKSLIKNKIDLLIDVRSTPYSRYVPHFNKENLMTSLVSKNIGYEHMADVGGRQPVSQENINTKDKFSHFKAYMKSKVFQDSIKKLESIIENKNAALMCSELDYIKCHRQFIGNELAKEGYHVKIIDRNGETNPQMLLGAFQ